MRHDGQAPTDVRPGLAQAEPARAGDRVRLFALAALTVVLIGLCILLAVPFLPAITWGVALAILAWPMHRRISRHVAQPGLAAGISTAVMVAVILGTGLFVTYQVAREAISITERVNGGAHGEVLRGKAAAVPGLGQVVAWMERAGLDVETEARRLILSHTRVFSDLAGGSARSIVQSLVMVFLLYYLFRDHSAFLDRVRELLPLSRAEGDLLLSRAGDSVHGILFATVVTSLIDAILFGFLFRAVGLPAPLLWAVVLFVLSLLPVLGSGMVWVPAAVYLAMTGRWLGAAALVGCGLLTAVLVDNLLYVRLVGDRMRMHEVPALISFLGGLALFGASGMILGPAILAVTEALWRSGSGGWPARGNPGRLGGLLGLRVGGRRSAGSCGRSARETAGGALIGRRSHDAPGDSTSRW